MNTLQIVFLHSEAGRTYGSFDNFKDVYERINLPKLHSWITKEKIREIKTVR